MNPIWLCRNIFHCWNHSEKFGDAVNRLRWIYAEKLPDKLRASEQVLGFRYRQPVRSVRLLVPANRGSDAFIFGEVFEHEYYRLSLPVPPSTILDLRANAGFTAVYFARVYPIARLACVEPVPDNLEFCPAIWS